MEFSTENALGVLSLMHLAQVYELEGLTGRFIGHASLQMMHWLIKYCVEV